MCQSSGGKSSRATTIDTWFTGALVATRMARSAMERPRNSQISAVAALAIASSAVIVAAGGTAVPVGRCVGGRSWVWRRWPVWVAAGVAVERRRRTYRSYDTDELRSRLHARLAAAGPGPG